MVMMDSSSNIHSVLLSREIVVNGDGDGWDYVDDN